MENLHFRINVRLIKSVVDDEMYNKHCMKTTKNHGDFDRLFFKTQSETKIRSF